MDIEILKNKRRLNVEEQNTLIKYRIFSEAKYWRENGVSLGFQKILIEREINSKFAIFLDYNQGFSGISTDEGIIITAEKKFIRFAMDLNSDGSELIFLDKWEDITEQYEISEYKKGIRKTYGFLALEVLEELNRV